MPALEKWREKRLLAIAMMAATLEAGDRAFSYEGGKGFRPVGEYAERAQRLFDAVDTIEVPK